ncbi:phosducin-like protein [Chrysoperla carnea]|uniref:phosducin-like protein n=1 Tax=Chrysoperla carnea TaxID=189513 RepID=UPI001D091A80|nr:phosducin-like protein [Chrysoperla carnea]
MATLDDKLLGEKVHNYCSSSESEDEDESDSENSKQGTNKDPAPPPPDLHKWEGSAANTGPKGVIKDWQRFKQLETESRIEQEKERIELIKKLSLTCRSALDEERDKEKDADLDDILNDEFLYAYQKQRMQEMIMQNEKSLPKFGNLINLKSGDEFLEAIDNEHKSVNVIIHIYEDYVPACRTMNTCLTQLTKEYVHVKFCKIIGSLAGMSRLFKVSGVPALLIYKGGVMVGNFIRLTDDLGDEFYPEEVESFLIEHGMLVDKTCVPPIISNENDDADSD